MRLSLQSPSSVPHRTQVQSGLWLDSRLALWVAAQRLLIVADLHWGYAASHRARGNLLPVWGDDEIEARLQSLVSDYQPAEMIWLGDVVHAAEGGARAEAYVRTSTVPITLLAGNHDRRWRQPCERSVTRGAFFCHHGDVAQAVPDGCCEVIGHHHPAVSWSDHAGTRLKLPALVASDRRLILPAFSPWAEGTAWNDQRSAGETLWAIAPNRIFALQRNMVSAVGVPV
jgi:metallophosphoesterase superfamily enzyme